MFIINNIKKEIIKVYSYLINFKYEEGEIDLTVSIVAKNEKEALELFYTHYGNRKIISIDKSRPKYKKGNRIYADKECKDFSLPLMEFDTKEEHIRLYNFNEKPNIKNIIIGVKPLKAFEKYCSITCHNAKEYFKQNDNFGMSIISKEKVKKIFNLTDEKLNEYITKVKNTGDCVVLNNNLK